jgi:hypothetical protein
MQRYLMVPSVRVEHPSRLDRRNIWTRAERLEAVLAIPNEGCMPARGGVPLPPSWLGNGAIMASILWEPVRDYPRFLLCTWRLDGAFFVPSVFGFLDEEELEYALKVPLWKWLGLREAIAVPRPWTRVNTSVEGFETAKRPRLVPSRRTLHGVDHYEHNRSDGGSGKTRPWIGG